MAASTDAGRALDVSDVEPNGRRLASGGHSQPGFEACVAQYGRVDSVREVGELIHRLVNGSGGVVQSRAGGGRVTVESVAGEPQLDRQRDQLLLGAVV